MLKTGLGCYLFYSSINFITCRLVVTSSKEIPWNSKEFRGYFKFLGAISCMKTSNITTGGMSALKKKIFAAKVCLKNCFHIKKQVIFSRKCRTKNDFLFAKTPTVRCNKLPV